MEAELIRRERRQTSSGVLCNLPLICCCCPTTGCNNNPELPPLRELKRPRPGHTAGEELRSGGEELALEGLGVGALGALHRDAPLFDPAQQPQEVAVAQQEGGLELPGDTRSVKRPPRSLLVFNGGISGR